jgi:pre-mRNA-splicing helicase BRR2
VPSKRAKRDAKDFLSELADVEGVTYRPKNRETRGYREQLLSFVSHYLGDVAHDVLAGAAEEVLAVLKDDALREPAKKAQCSELLGRLTDTAFTQLTNLGKGISDYSASAAGSGGGGAAGAASASSSSSSLDEEQGVAVVYDDEDDEEGTGSGTGIGGVHRLGDDFEDEIREDADYEDEEEAGGGGAMRALEPTAAAAEEEAAGIIPVHKLDAFWLQRSLAKHYPDPVACSRVADEVLDILGTGAAAPTAASGGAGAASAAVASGARGADIRAVENRLVGLLDYDKFDLILVC